MPNIELNIWARIHQRSLDRAKRDLNTRFQDMGREAGEKLSEGIEKAGPRTRRAILSVTDATAAHTKQVQDLGKAESARAKEAAKALKLDRDIEDQRRRIVNAGKAELALDNQLKAARKQAEEATAKLSEKEAAHDTLRRQHAKTIHEVEQRELDLRQARIDGLRGTDEYKFIEQELVSARRRSSDEGEQLAVHERDLANERNRLKDLTAEASDIERRHAVARKEHLKATKDLDAAEGDLRKTKEAASKIDDVIADRNDRVTRSNNRRLESLRRLNEVRDNEESRRNRGSRRSGASIVGNMLTDIPFVPSGPAGAVIGGGIVTILGSVAEAVVTASQALATVPAIATAAAAGIGTLAIATHGFGDALKDMGDPDKFATALQSLSPSAQQAALEIQHLAQGPLKDLQQTAQETLFNGVAEKLHNATGQLLPSMGQLTEGVSGSFNAMLGNLLTQVTSPGSLSAINDIVNNIVSSFQHLEPAVAPFTDAITKIIQTGSSFLPGFSDAITRAANSFSNFITTAQANGSLQSFMQKGIDAAVSLGKVIWDIGKKIYETFGNKSPEQFAQTLNDVVDVAFAIADAITAASNVLNEFLKILQPIVDFMGGWKSAIGDVIAGWIGFKGLNLISHIGDIGGALKALPSAAEVAAKGISSKLAMIVVPEIGKMLNDSIQEFLKDNAPSLYEANNSYTPDQLGRSARQWFNEHILGQKPPGNTPAPGSSQDFIGGAGVPGTAQDFIGNGGAQPGSVTNPSGILDPYKPSDVPAPPPEGSTKSRRDEIRSTLNPNDFMPNLGFAPSATPAGVPPLQYGTNGQPYQKPGYGYVDIDQRKVSDAQWDVQKQAQQLRDARMNLAVLEKDNTATEEELLHAREKVADEEHQFTNSQLDLVEAQQGKWKKVSKDMASSMGKLGAGLDADLGLSKGIGGLADNLVRFIGNLATAPIQAMLQRQIDANPGEGSGLIGILAARGAFGSQFTPQGIANGGGISNPTLSSAADGVVRGAAYPGESARDFAHRAMMPFWQNQGLTVGDHAADKCGEHQNGALDIMVGSLAEGQKVLSQVLSDPNVYGAIFDNKTYGYGHGSTPQDYTAGHTGNPTQDHQDHVHAWYKPGGQNNINPGGTPSPMSAPTTAGATPVFVTNWPGGVGGMAGAPIPGMGGQGDLGGPQGVASMIYQQALSRGYSPHDAQSIVAYAIGESSLNPKASGGVQGDDEVLGLFQQKSAFARGGGIDPSQRTDPVANTTAYLNQLEKHRNLPIEQALPATSVGGPLASGPGAQPQNWTNLMDRAAKILGQDIYSPANTNPATPSLDDLRKEFTGGGGEGPIFKKSPSFIGSGASPGAGNAPVPDFIGPAAAPSSAARPASPNPAIPGIGNSVGQTPAYQPTQQPQAPKSWQPSGSGAGGGGGILGAAAGAAAGMFPGGGAAAQIAMQMIQRSIQFGGEIFGAVSQGVLSSLSVSDPDGGGGTDMSESWLGRLAGSMASAAPSLPTNAGGQDKNLQPQAQADPNAQQHGQGDGQNPGPLIGTMNVQADKATGQQMANQFAYAAASAGLHPG